MADVPKAARQTGSNPGLDTCDICKKPMPNGALKCNECNEYQFTFSRWMARFNVTALLAVLPLLTLIYAFVADRLEGQYSLLNVGGLTCESDGISFFATNSGNRHALIDGVEFLATGTDRGKLSLSSDTAHRVFAPGDAKLLSFDVDKTTHAGGLVSFPGLQATECLVGVDVRILNFDQSLDERHLTCECP